MLNPEFPCLPSHQIPKSKLEPLRAKYLMAWSKRVSCRTMFCQCPVVTISYGMFYVSIVKNNPFNHPLKLIEYRLALKLKIYCLNEAKTRKNSIRNAVFTSSTTKSFCFLSAWKREGDWDKSSPLPLDKELWWSHQLFPGQNISNCLLINSLDDRVSGSIFNVVFKELREQ